MNNKLIKILGFAAVALGAVATLVTEFVNEKKMDEKIEEKINEALANKDEDES